MGVAGLRSHVPMMRTVLFWVYIGVPLFMETAILFPKSVGSAYTRPMP